MRVLKAGRAIWTGTAIGTKTICAPITSLSFQPKPLVEPYLSTMTLGAAEGTEWRSRQLAVAMMG